MKRLISTILAVVFSTILLNAFTTREHAAIAIIAERHLNSKALKCVNDILEGEHMACVSSVLDQYRKVMLRDGLQIPHMIQVDSLGEVTGDVTNNACFVVENAVGILKGYKKGLDPEVAREELLVIIHLVGDMHCPSHCNWCFKSDKFKPKTFEYKGETVKFHSAWDSFFIAQTYSAGDLDMAYLADVASPSQIKEIQKGSIRDWLREDSMSSYKINHMLDTPVDNLEVDRVFVTECGRIAKDQVMKAGYRLAKVLNELFK